LLLIGLLGSARGLENSFNRLFGSFATNSVFVWAQNTSKPFKGFQEGRRVQLTLTNAKKIEENVHRLKHKISILGLEKSYKLAEEFEDHLKEGRTTGYDTFHEILQMITDYLETL
jgi:HPt (histidine-containing phosphotransfer) domain-containing protein